jgi:hypothetical protein
LPTSCNEVRLGLWVTRVSAGQQGRYDHGVAGRRLAGIVGGAAGVGVASLVLAQLISHHGAVAVLFVLFLIATFTLLATAVFTSEQWVQGVWASRETWSHAPAPRRRWTRRLLIAAHDGLMRVRRLARAALGRVRFAFTRDGRHRIADAVRHASHVAMEQLGLPLEERGVAPVYGTAEHARVNRNVLARHRRGDGDRWQTFMPTEYRQTRDALEKATAAAKARNASLRVRCAPAKATEAPPPSPDRASATREVRHPKPHPDGMLRRAFTTKRGRAAREALKKAGHTALVSAMGILPERGSVTAK